MNERIKALAEQCRTITDYGMGKYELFDEVKFAELIIKECANVCDTHMWGLYGHGSSIHDDADRRWELIRQHFGVKE
jgi:hypothetical protein